MVCYGDEVNLKNTWQAIFKNAVIFGRYASGRLRIKSKRTPHIILMHGVL